MELLSDGGRAVELSGGVEQAARARSRAKQRKTIRRFMVWLLSGLGGAPPLWAGGRGSVGVECVRVYPILNAKDVLVGVVLKKGN